MSDTVYFKVRPVWVEEARKNALEGKPPRDAILPDPLEERIEHLYKDLFRQDSQPILADADAVADRLHKTREALAKTKQDITGLEDVEHLQQSLRTHLEEARPENVRRMNQKFSDSAHLKDFKYRHGL